MKNIFKSLLGLGSSKKAPETPTSQLSENDAVAKLALESIFGKINTLHNASLKDNEIVVGDASVRLKVAIEFDGQQKGKWIYAANITTFYKAGEEIQFNIGSIGIGDNKKEAVQVCLEEWFASFALPFTDMIKQDKVIAIAGMEVFAGLLGIRGRMPQHSWLNENGPMADKIIGQIQELIKNEKGNIIPVDIKLVIDANGVSDGECRINNNVSPQLLASLKKLDWPPSNEGFMLKQFYLIKKTGK